MTYQNIAVFLGKAGCVSIYLLSAKLKKKIKLQLSEMGVKRILSDINKKKFSWLS